MSSKVYLVDGSGYIFRAFYAVQPLTTKEGFPTNALLGYSRMLIKLLGAADSEHVAVVFDAGRETFRNALYPLYKANRTEAPPELALQFPFFREISSALGLQILEQKGYEADDIIATLATRLAASGHEVVIVSGDKDLMQLVGDKVSIWDTMKDKRIGAAEVKEKFGVPPHQVVEVLGLTGDSSDNIPGLKGVGEKTAAQLIELFGSVEGVLANVEEIKNDARIRNRKKIAEQIELDGVQLRLSRKLVEVDRSTPFQVFSGNNFVDAGALTDTELVEALLRRPPNGQKLDELAGRLEFTSVFKDFKSARISTADIESPYKYETVTRAAFPQWLELFLQQREYAVDLETTSLNFHEAKVVGLAFAWSDEGGYYIPVGHLENPETQMSFREVIEAIGSSLRDSAIGKIGQNLKYDQEVFTQQGVELEGISFDTMIAAYLINPDRRSINLGSLAHDFLGLGVSEYVDVVGELENFSHVGIAAATRYAAEDAHIAWMLRGVLAPKLKELSLEKVFYEIEVPLVSVLARLERRGIALDVEFLKKLSEEYELELVRIRHELYELAGTEFNINSPKQLSEILFDKLGLSAKGLKRTKTGTSTDSSVLEQLSSVHPLPAKILEYRLLFKLKSTYIDALPLQVAPQTGRVHTRFNQAGTATGRLSSSDPNLQNIPIQSREGRRIREAFVAPIGRTLISADYSQIELRILAHLSGDKALCHAFNSGEDVHAATAREILSIPPMLPVSPEQRRMGKTINFGLVYGMSGFRLGKELGIPVGVANQYIENYFKRYAGVRDLFRRYEEEAVSQGYVTTMFGRRRYVSDLDMSGRDKGFAMRVAINAPIQGSAADIIKLAMIALEERLRKTPRDVRMLLQIHDELVFECADECADEAVEMIRTEMEQVVKCQVPLRVDIGRGRTWQESHG